MKYLVEVAAVPSSIKYLVEANSQEEAEDKALSRFNRNLQGEIQLAFEATKNTRCDATIYEGED